MLQIPLLHAEKLCYLPEPCSPGSQLEEGYSPSYFSIGLPSDGKWGALQGAKRSGTLFHSCGLYFYLNDSKKEGIWQVEGLLKIILMAAKLKGYRERESQQ